MNKDIQTVNDMYKAYVNASRNLAMSVKVATVSADLGAFSLDATKAIAIVNAIKKHSDYLDKAIAELIGGAK